MTPNEQMCADLILKEGGYDAIEEDTEAHYILESAAKLLVTAMGLTDQEDRVKVHNWSLNRRMVYSMDVGKSRLFPASEAMSVRTNIQRLGDIYDMKWKTKTIGSSLKITRTK
jgi:hypothetical protein